MTSARRCWRIRRRSASQPRCWRCWASCPGCRWCRSGSWPLPPVPPRGRSCAAAGAQAAVAATPALPAPGVAPLVIEVADDLLAAAREPRLSATLRERLFEELGVPLPPLEVRSGSASLSPGDYVIWLKEIPMARGTALGPDAVTELTAHALAVLRRHAGEFVGLAETQALLDSLARGQPTLVRALVPAKIEPGLLADVLRRLLAEEISIRNLPDILQVLAEAARADSDPAVLTEQVRQGALRRWITYRFTDGAATLEAFLL